MLLAKVYMYLGRYAEAEKKLAEIIDKEANYITPDELKAAIQ